MTFLAVLFLLLSSALMLGISIERESLFWAVVNIVVFHAGLIAIGLVQS